jgi:Flp pilus assembly CpaE family ATPase
MSSIDGGVPILEFDPPSAVAAAIVDLQRELRGAQPVERMGLLRRALPLFTGND